MHAGGVQVRGVQVLGDSVLGDSEVPDILSAAALEFLAILHRRFDGRRRALLAMRGARREELARGVRPDFLAETGSVRSDPDWRVAPPPPDLQDRRVEITGPVERKMIINALNSRAQVFMADFEDSNAPTWRNVIGGQRNLYDAVRRTISFTSPEGRDYVLGDTTATLVVRPRGWHLPEQHLVVDGTPMSGALVDFGLFFFHNARELVARGSGPYFYLPKLESHLEARLWNDVFLAAQAALDLPVGTVRATVLIETILAAFEMDEILFELREHSSGLNCGRWDYLFSVIKKFHDSPGFMLGDRSSLTMTTHFMRSYSLLTVKTCHRRGAHAIGGMAAQIPLKDPVANEEALAKVRADKEREAGDGHDGTWVAHPGLVPVARAAFDAVLVGPDQRRRLRDDVDVSPDDLLDFAPRGPITERGVRTNVDVALRYLGAWLAGNGCVPIAGLMEDAATAEISRSQLWQWTHSDAAFLDDGRPVDFPFVQRLLDEQLEHIRADAPDGMRLDEAAKLLGDLITRDELAEFLTLPAYEILEV